MPLGIKHPDAVKRPAEVPVRGVQYPHISKLTGAYDIPWAARRSR
jgi:hypothetical protein